MSGLLGFGRDTLQSASNAIAGNVSGPVDLINMGLLSLGLPMPANPVGGSRWMAERGLTREVADPYARAAGETLGLVGPMVAAAKAPQIAEGLLNHADAYRRYHAATTAPGAPATVWHGSPHRFDKFDSSKIGTGEGAQVYGHGLYLAENPKVAIDYRKRLADASSPFTYSWRGQQYEGGVRGDPVAHALGLTHHHGSATAKKIAQQGLLDAKAGQPYALEMGGVDYYQQMLNAARQMKKGDIKAAQGHVYKVDLPDEAIARMLDWDKPINAQAPEVLDMLRRAGINEMSSGLAGPMARGQEAHLQKFGIPGIRYLDGGSRAAGAGTSNYVVFPGNENLLTILGRE